MLNRAIYLLYAKDSYAAMDYLHTLGSPGEVAANYSELVRHLYWQEKDILGMVMVARAGIQYGLSFTDPDVRLVAKTIAYNLASYTWPGWDEEDIVLDATTIAMGMDAAKINVRLAKELDREDIAKSRAHWLLGAHFLAQDNLDTARHHFYRAAIYANRGQEHPVETLLARAYAMLTKQAREEYVALIRELEVNEGGPALVEQLGTAQRVFNLWFDNTPTQASEEQTTTVIDS